LATDEIYVETSMRGIEILSALRPWWLAGSLFILSGCGAGGAGEQADPAKAQETLRAVLDAWKTGAKLDELAKRTPPIHVKDLDWMGGFKLTGYQAEAAGKLVGYDMTYPVVLELESPKGKSVKKNAVYTVTTGPELLVSRQEG
jgi:hypothetical protein